MRQNSIFSRNRANAEIDHAIYHGTPDPKKHYRPIGLAPIGEVIEQPLSYEVRGNEESSSVRPLEDIKSDMEFWDQRYMDISSQLHEEQGGFRWFTRDEEKVKQLEDDMEIARENYKRAEEEYKNHPDYYEDYYWYNSGFDKMGQGIVNTTVATIPVLGQILDNEGQTIKKYAEDDSEDKPGLFDGKLDGKLSALDEYREPIDMDSGAMQLMEEGMWLQDSGSGTFGGGVVNIADGILGAWWPYAILSGARNVAEGMYGQLAQGKTTGEALSMGTLTAAGEVLKGVIPMDDLLKVVGQGGTKAVEDILSAIGVPLGQGMVSYAMDFILEKVNGGAAAFDPLELLQSIVTAFGESILKKDGV